MNDSWVSGHAYEGFMGRWSILVARAFLSWLAVPPGRAWADVGCGTGSLTRSILENCEPASILAIDSSSDLIAFARRTISNPAARFSVGDAQALEVPSNTLDAAVSGLVLNFVPQPRAAVSEMLRVTKPGGRIGIFVWDYADGMQMLRYFWDAAVALDESARDLDEGTRFPLCRERQLETLVREIGLKQVEARPIEISTVFRDFDDYWQPLLGSVGPAPGYAMSLDQQHRRALENSLRNLLPVNDDGSISLMARAWAVKGTA
jgi:SAM-dependent methyltransferase